MQKEVKYITRIVQLIVTISFILVTIHCTKEPAEEPSGEVEFITSPPYKAGERVELKIPIENDKVTVFPGDRNHVYDSVLDKGFAVTEELWGYEYREKGTFTMTIILTNYGNWGEDHKKKKMEFEIEVLDTRTDFKSFKFSNADAEISINESTKVIHAVVPQGTDLTSLVVKFRTRSPEALVYVNDVLQESGETINDFTNDVIYRIVAPDDTEEYTVKVTTGT